MTDGMNSDEEARMLHAIAMRHIEQDAAERALLALICHGLAPDDTAQQLKLKARFEALKQRFVEQALIELENKDPGGAAFLASPPTPPKTPP